MSEYIYATDGDTVQNMLSEIFEPLQEIVRCRDCVFYEFVAEDSGDWCGYWTDMVYVNVRGDGFCAWGERKERIEQ